MELEQEILRLRNERYDTLSAILQRLNEAQLNSQPLENKRSLAELIAHIFLVDSFPFGIAKIVQKTVMAKMVSKALNRKLDGSDYVWNLEKGKKRKPKYIKKDRLMKKLQIIKPKILDLDYRESDMRYRYFSEYHANFHLRQLELLVDRAGFKIKQT